METLKQEGSDQDMEGTSSSPMTNGLSAKKDKGKAKAIEEDESSDEEDEDEDEARDLEELVLCTLDPSQVGVIVIVSLLSKSR